MSLVYWGIVAGIAAMVATLFVCLELLHSNGERAPGPSSRMTDGQAEAARQPSTPGRHAA